MSQRSWKAIEIADLALAPIGGGAVEAVPMRMVDVILSIPAILFAIILAICAHELPRTQCVFPNPH
jgi:ABC-type dipeptide/oligopeptide/nickel transport system permease subunit